MEIKTKYSIGQGVYYLYESIREKNNVSYIEREMLFGFIEDITISPYGTV